MPLHNGYLLNDRYEIRDILGQGGMGAVYRALDKNLDTIVAIKENAFLSDDYARQFQREAKVLASLRHPNLPRVFDYFVIDKQGQYLVMDYIEGNDLHQWMTKENNLSEIEAIQIGIEICNALIYLHSRTPPIIHRDIKPGNIKITPDGEVILVDFGLVKINDDKELTTTAARAMTPGYSPPEQYGDSPTDKRSDIFSLGATLYAALAGYLPEDSLTRTTGKAVLTPLKNHNPEVSPALQGVIQKALSLRFEDRWQSAQEFKEALMMMKDVIAKEEWHSDHLPLFKNLLGGPSDNNFTNEKKNNTLEKPLSLAQHWSKQLDPVWIVIGSLVLLMLIALTISLLWPSNIRPLFVGVSHSERTKTLSPLAVSTQIKTTVITTLERTLAKPTATETRVDPAPFQSPLKPSQTPTGGGVGMIAYVSERTGAPQIWLLDIMNTSTYQLTFLEEGACQPDWSPNGDRIVFTSPCPGKRSKYTGTSLQILDITENDITTITTSLEGDFDPAWSPDGDWIAYTSLINGQMQMYKINIRDQSVVKLSDGVYNDHDPAWSPDGDQLVFVRHRGIDQIWIMDADGESPVQFTLSGAIDNSNPCWYPQEGLILFSQVLGLRSPSKQLYGMRIEDIGQHEEYPVLPANQTDYIPLMDNADISPDGTWLAFDYWYFDLLSDIYIMTFPGSNLQQMTKDPAVDYDPVWRPLP